MSQKPDKTNPKLTFAPFNMSVLTLGGQVGCSTLVIVFAAVFGGLWLDRVFDTKPIFTLFFVLGSAPLALIFTYWMAMRSLRDASPPLSDTTETQIDKEELSGE